MQDFLRFTLSVVQSDNSGLRFMEQRTSEWAPLLASRLRWLLAGRSFILLTDPNTEWFESYFLSNLNTLKASRPWLPFVSLRGIFPRVDELKRSEDFAMLDDLLSVTFSSGFAYFYIGRGDHPRANIAKNSEASYMWLFNEQSQNGFCLDSTDNTDAQLVALFGLFDKSLDAVLSARVGV